MQSWRMLKEKLQRDWYDQRQRKMLLVIVAGLALLLGIGLGIYRNWPEEGPSVDVVSRDEIDAVIETQVQNIIADLYPWVLEGPTIQLVSVEPPTSPIPEPTETRPEPEAVVEALSFEHLIWPVQGDVTTPFGWYRHPIYGDWRFNAGVEFTATGDQVRTVLAGEVVSVTSNELETELIIDHGSGWSSVYRSIRGISVTPGEKVQQNQKIALPESTGLVFFGLNHNNEPVNPQAFLR